MDNKVKEPRFVYLFNEDIEIEHVQKLIEVLHSHNKIDLYFFTDGGMVLAMEALLHYMNQHPDLRIFLTYQVYSTGFEIITHFKGKILFTKNLDLLMIHAADRRMFSTRRENFDTKRLLKYTKERNEDYYQKLREDHNFTEKEIKKLMSGEDVYIYREDFPRIIGNKTNITIL